MDAVRGNASVRSGHLRTLISGRRQGPALARACDSIVDISESQAIERLNLYFGILSAWLVPPVLCNPHPGRRRPRRGYHAITARF